MAIALMIVQFVLGLIFVVTGCFKLFQSREKVIASGGTWAEDFDPITVRLVAAVELICGSALILDRILGPGRNLTFTAAVSISLIMTGAIYIHIRRREFQHALINLLILLLALFIANAGRPF